METIACPDCDLLQRIPPLRPGCKARCARCGETLVDQRADPLSRPLALTLAATIALVIANSTPLMGLSAVGREASTTIIGGALEMWRQGSEITAVIVAFSVLFAMAVSALGEKGRPILRACESLSQIMFRFTSYVMLFAPIGVGAAMAHTVGTQGLNVLVNLGKLIGSLYLALAILISFVFGAVVLIARIPLLKFIKAVREPATIAFVTTSSESALPKAMEVMERLGVPPRIVGFVLPTGYSFNLDGTTLYLAMASIFGVNPDSVVLGACAG